MSVVQFFPSQLPIDPAAVRVQYGGRPAALYVRARVVYVHHDDGRVERVDHYAKIHVYRLYRERLDILLTHASLVGLVINEVDAPIPAPLADLVDRHRIERDRLTRRAMS